MEDDGGAIVEGKVKRVERVRVRVKVVRVRKKKKGGFCWGERGHAAHCAALITG